MATRSIIGPGFEDWVQKQITVRQDKNRLANRDRDQLIYQNVNTAFLRLTSGVNVATSFDSLNNATGYDNGAEAKTYQLFNTRFNDKFAAGVGIGAFNTAYGFQSTSDYGFVPPPGLISADVKSLNRGALRDATINIVCHSATQFEIIDQLYLRLGYSMLLEWGWSTYYDNNGDFQNATTQVDVVNKFLTNGTEQATLLTEIQNQRSGSNGNYDAMFGLVKNFSWNLEKDGSYNITLNLVSVGDVIESLKQNVSHPTAVQTDPSPPEDQPPLQYNADKSSLNKILYYLSTQLPPDNISVNGGWSSYLQGNQTTADIIGNLIGLKPNQRNDRLNSQGDMIAFIFPQLLGVNNTKSGYNAQYYMKLGLLLRSIQNFCLLYDTSKPNSENNLSSLFNINFEEEENFMFTFPRHGSLDPRVCLIDVLSDLTGTVGQDPNQQSYIGNINEYKWYTIVVDQESNATQAQSGLFGNNVGNEKLLDQYNQTANTPGYTILDNYFGGEFGIIYPPGIEPVGGISTATNDNFRNKIDQLILNYTPTAGYIKKNSGTPQPFTSTNATVFSFDSMAWLGTSTQDPLATTMNKFVNNANTSEFEDEFYDVITAGKYIKMDWDIGEGKEAILANNGVFYSGSVIKTEPFRGLTAQGTLDFTLKIKEYKIQTISITKTSTGYVEGGLNNGGDGTDTTNNLFNNIRPGINFRVDKDAHPFIGRTMNMYVNMNFAAKTLEQFIEAKNGSISVYDFLDRLMTGIQQALGNVNNFTINYDETTNTFSILDSTFIPGLDGYKPEAFKNTPAEFVTHTLDSTAGSFMRDASVKTQLSNNFATQVTVGAQANGNVVGENATALSRWNNGLVDRIILEKGSNNNGQGTTTSDIDQKFYTNIGIVQNLYRFIDDGNITDQQIEGSRDAAVDLFKYEIGLYTKEGYIPGIGFMPINLELTMDGLSGMKIYESYTADTRLLPPKYKNSIQFIITGVSHRIQNNDWTTTITSISGPKYTGFKSTGTPPAVKTHGLKIADKTIDTVNQGNAEGFPITLGDVSGNVKPINELKQATQEILKNYQGLVVVREAANAEKTIGAMYYKSKLIGVTVEDPLRESKIKNQTGIPPVKSGETYTYNLTLSTTSKPSIAKSFVDFGDGKGLIGPRIGTDKSGVNIDGPGNLDWSGIRIHAGGSAKDSEGCLLLGNVRKANGDIVFDRSVTKEVTKLIKSNGIYGIIFVNDF